MFFRIGIDFGYRLIVDSRLEATFDATIVGRVVAHSVAAGHVVRPRSNDVSKRRAKALDCRHKIRVQAELQYSSALRLAGELCVDHFVAPRPEFAHTLNALQDVGAAHPTVGPKCTLRDDLVATGHGLTRARDRFIVDPDTFDDSDR